LDWFRSWQTLTTAEIDKMNFAQLRNELTIVKTFVVIDTFNIAWSIFVILFAAYVGHAQPIFFAFPPIVLTVFFANLLKLLTKYSGLKPAIRKLQAQ
jgi:hypothetical protein